MEPFPIGRDDLREVIAAELRDGLPLDANGVRDALIAHLGTRLDVMQGNLAELPAEVRKPQELADMLCHLRRWEQGLPDEPATNADIAPFEFLLAGAATTHADSAAPTVRPRPAPCTPSSPRTRR